MIKIKTKNLSQLLSFKGVMKLEQMNKIGRDIPTKIKINSNINKNIHNNNQMPILPKRKLSSIDNNNLIKRREIKSPRIIQNSSQKRIKFRSEEAEKSKKENIDINLPKIEDKKNNDKENIERTNIEFTRINLDSYNDSLEFILQMIQKGYIPLFMKLNDYKPLYFFTRGKITLKYWVEFYIKWCPETDEELVNDIRLYHDQRLLDINTPIEFLNLQPLSIIRNRIGNL